MSSAYTFPFSSEKELDNIVSALKKMERPDKAYSVGKLEFPILAEMCDVFDEEILQKEYALTTLERYTGLTKHCASHALCIQCQDESFFEKFEKLKETYPRYKDLRIYTYYMTIHVLGYKIYYDRSFIKTNEKGELMIYKNDFTRQTLTPEQLDSAMKFYQKQKQASCV